MANNAELKQNNDINLELFVPKKEVSQTLSHQFNAKTEVRISKKSLFLTLN